MPRILNINLPKNKTILIGLTYIKGIGLSRAKLICSNLNISENKKLKELTKEEIKDITYFIDTTYLIGNKMIKNKITNIKNLIKISSYRGFRHVKGLPLRGQRTHTNSKTSRKFKNKY